MTLDEAITKSCEELNVIMDGDVFGAVFSDDIERTYEDVKREVYSAAQTYDLFF